MRSRRSWISSDRRIICKNYHPLPPVFSIDLGQLDFEKQKIIKIYSDLTQKQFVFDEIVKIIEEEKIDIEQLFINAFERVSESAADHDYLSELEGSVITDDDELRHFKDLETSSMAEGDSFELSATYKKLKAKVPHSLIPPPRMILITEKTILSKSRSTTNHQVVQPYIINLIFKTFRNKKILFFFLYNSSSEFSNVFFSVKFSTKKI